jgi:HlyD family secretion protein
MKKRVAIIVVVLAAAGLTIGLLKNRAARRANGPLQLYGNVDIREANLGFRVAGKLKEMLKDEGDGVAAGDVLARLDPAPFQRELDEAQAQVASLQARVRLLEAGYRTQEVAQARAVVNEREVTKTNAERLYNRQEELFRSGAASVQDRDDAEARYREAAARLKSVQEQLSVQEAGFRPEEIAQAKADLARAEAAARVSELRVEDSVLRAPAAGVVLTRAQEPGAMLPVGTAVFTVSLLRPVWVRAYVSEPELGRIHPGMKVSVYTDTASAKTYEGTIGFISPRAEFTPKNVETPELRTSLVYRLRVVVDNPDEALRQGMPVTIRLRS